MSAIQKLYIQCNPLLDISANVDEAFLDEFKVERGLPCLMREDQAGIFAAIEKRPNVTYVPGGSGLNTARVAQWMAQVPNGTFVTYVGCVADDKYGHILRESSEKCGVNMVLETTTKKPTGSCAACIRGTERSLCANLGAAECITAEYMKGEAVCSALAGCKLFYTPGFTLTIDVNYNIQIAEAARAAGGAYILNLSAPYVIEYFKEQVNTVLPYADIIFCNDDEAKILAKVRGWNLDNVAEIAAKAAKELPYTGKMDRLVVFTQGSQPTVYATKSGKSGAVNVKPIPAEKIVDTNGAGDSFVGGFLAGYAKGHDVDRCCELGNYAAGVVIQHDGCTFPEKPEMSA